MDASGKAQWMQAAKHNGREARIPSHTVTWRDARLNTLTFGKNTGPSKTITVLACALLKLAHPCHAHLHHYQKDPITKKVRCTICKDGDPGNFGRWINKSSLVAHLQSNIHSAHLQSLEQKSQDASNRSRALQENYAGPNINLDPSALDPSTSARMGMFDDYSDTHLPSPGPDDLRAAGFMAPIIPAFIAPVVHNPEIERENLRQQVLQMLWHAEELDEFGERTDQDDITAPPNADIYNENYEEDEEEDSGHEDPQYSPYPNRICGVPSVPSYRSFRKMQTGLRKLCGSEPTAHTSSVVNWFFMNDVRDTVAGYIQDFANPEVAKHLNFYPEEASGPISEVWQAERWKELKPSELTSIFARGLRQFYIDKVSELDTGEKTVLKLFHPQGYKCAPMPNPVRELAQGDDLYVVLVPFWADDVSGNKSKLYGKHISVYAQISNLPGWLLQQEYFLRFVSTSPDATSPEQFSTIKEQIHNPRRLPIWEKMRILAVADAWPAAHMSTQSPMRPGISRSAAETKKTLEDQIDLAMYGVESPIKKLQTATGVKDKVAQYWIEILLEKARKMKAEDPSKSVDDIAEDLRICLAAQPGDKLNPLPDIHAAYMMQYKNGLIGKHFKTLMQTMVFHVHGLVSDEMFTLVKAVCALSSVLGVHEIDDMKEYTEDLTILIGDVLDAFGDNDPAKIIKKNKIHLLPHIVKDAVRFGPPIRNSTETFEGYSGVFRLCSILSNHQAPSRDIAAKFVSMDRLKHVLSGGHWKQDGDWVCTGPTVRTVLKTMPIIQRHLGWVLGRTIVSGTDVAQGKPCRNTGNYSNFMPGFHLKRFGLEMGPNCHAHYFSPPLYRTAPCTFGEGGGGETGAGRETECVNPPSWGFRGGFNVNKSWSYGDGVAWKVCTGTLGEEWGKTLAQEFDDYWLK
ncbi:hypothetical protein DFH09DRAFT_1114311 [Mycena vulgaris]|nr:hypothetical protein DFH09DRAFT_1114311 [Mycena vulgaris]